MATQKTPLSPTDSQDGIESFIGKRELKGIDVETGVVRFRIRSSTGGGPDGPDYTVPISAILPGREDDTPQFWKMLVGAVVKLLREHNQFPNFIKGYTVNVGEDSSGDPALYIRLGVTPQKNYTKATVSEWNRFSNLLHSYLMGLRLQRYPYIQVGESRGSK